MWETHALYRVTPANNLPGHRGGAGCLPTPHVRSGRRMVLAPPPCRLECERAGATPPLPHQGATRGALPAPPSHHAPLPTHEMTLAPQFALPPRVSLLEVLGPQGGAPEARHPHASKKGEGGRGDERGGGRRLCVNLAPSRAACARAGRGRVPRCPSASLGLGSGEEGDEGQRRARGWRGREQAGAAAPWAGPGAHAASDRGLSSPAHAGEPWTEDEHLAFLGGLERFGKVCLCVRLCGGGGARGSLGALRRGAAASLLTPRPPPPPLFPPCQGNWKSISKHCVPTRTPTQVASHAQVSGWRGGRASSPARALARPACPPHPTPPSPSPHPHRSTFCGSRAAPNAALASRR